jgi:hypothetical protein
MKTFLSSIILATLFICGCAPEPKIENGSRVLDKITRDQATGFAYYTIALKSGYTCYLVAPIEFSEVGDTLHFSNDKGITVESRHPSK